MPVTAVRMRPKQRQLVHAVLFVSLTACISATARESSNSTDSLKSFDNIVITGRSKIDDLRKSPEAATIIDAAELRGRSISLEDVLDRAAGIKVRSSGGLGSGTRVMIHGLEGDRVQVLIDGSPLNAPKGTFNLDDIPIDLIERIEVYKGIVPARFGGDGIGGAVNVVIRDFDPDYVDLTYSYGSYNTHRSSWVIKKNFNKIGWRTGVGGLFNYSDNDYSFSSPFQEGLTIRRENDKFSSFVIAAPQKFTKLWFDEIALEPIFLLGKKDIQGIQKNYKFVTSDYWAALLEFKLEKEAFILDNLDFEYSAVYIPFGEMRFIDTSHYQYDFYGDSTTSAHGRGEEGIGPNNSADKLVELRQRLNMTYSINAQHDLNLNSAFRYAKKTFSDSLADLYAGFTTSQYPGELTSIITGLTWEANTKSRRFANILSGKIFYYQSSLLDDGSVEGGLIAEPEVKTHDQAAFGFSEAVKWEPVEDLGLKASYQLAYKLPTNDELFGDGKLIHSSPELKPEKANNANVGVYIDLSDILHLHRVRFDATGFYRYVTDMIRIVEGTMGSRYQNSPKIKIRGFDAELKVDVTNWLYLNGNVTVQDARDALVTVPGTSAPNPTFDLKVPHMPGFFFNLGAELHTADLFGLFGKKQYSKIFWNAQFVDEYFYAYEVSALQHKRVPQSFLQHAGVQQSFVNDRYILSAEVHNIFNKEAVSLYQQPLPGRTFAVKVRMALVGKE